MITEREKDLEIHRLIIVQQALKGEIKELKLRLGEKIFND